MGGRAFALAGRAIPVLLAAALSGFVPGWATAQQALNNPRGPSVTVDYSVLDALGPEPNVPSVMLRAARPNGALPYATVSPYATTRPRFPVPTTRATPAPSRRIVLTPPGTRKRSSPVRQAARQAPVRRTALPPPKPAPPKPVPPKRVAKKPPAKKTPARVAAKPPPAPKPPEAPAPLAPPPPLGDLPPPPTIAALPPPAVSSLPPPGMPDVPKTSPPPAAPKLAPQPMSAAPKPAAPAATTPKPEASAAAPPRGDAPIGAGGQVRLLFDRDSATLSKETSEDMNRVARSLKADDALRIQLLAYAGGSSESASQARRLSLSRALAARSYLIGQGVRSTRIDVRALGSRSSGGPPDRVDILVARR